MAINREGNRVPVFVFSNRQHGRLIAIVEIDQTKANNESVTIHNVTAVWPNGTTTVPRDTPKCGFQGEKCLKAPEGEWIRLMSSSFRRALVELEYRVMVQVGHAAMLRVSSNRGPWMTAGLTLKTTVCFYFLLSTEKVEDEGFNYLWLLTLILMLLVIGLLLGFLYYR